MGAHLTVHNAEIKTAAVEINALTVSGKQVTLAVFRQLLNRPLINSDGSMAGLPWGTVNYHPDKCADDMGHVHVVWQDGADLRRACVWVPDADADAKRSERFAEYCDPGRSRYGQHGEQLAAYYASETEEHAHHYAHLATIEALPQLFIAV